MEIEQMKKGKSIRAFLIAVIALALVFVAAICVFGADGTVIRGDVNGDGKVNSYDADYLLMHASFPNNPKYAINQSGDMNGDGKVNSYDADRLLMHASFPNNPKYALACDHKEVIDSAKPATCTETGLTEGKHCSVCGKVLVEQKVIPITHDYDEQNASIIIENDGSSAVKRTHCKKCSAYSEIPYSGYYVSGMSAYKFDEDGRRENLTNVFIEFAGNTYYVVNNVIVTNYYIIDGKVYDFGDDGKKRDTVINNVYVTIDGDTYYIVNNVVVKNYYIIDGKVYDFGDDGKKRDTIINNIIVSIGGSKYYVVNNVIVINIYVFDDGHIYRFGSSGAMLAGTEFGGYIFDNDGWLTSNGKTIYMEIDGTVYEITGNIAKKHTHNYSEKITPPTCTNKGYTEHTCPCGSTYKDNEKPVIAHNYVDDVCTMCGKKLKTSEGLGFYLNSDKKSYSVYIGSCKDNDIVIPSTYGGLPVTSIGRTGFSSRKNITSVWIPDSITVINNGAFMDCVNLACVTFGNHSKLTSIGDGAFRDCESLESIAIPDSVTSIGPYAFGYTDLKEVRFGENSKLDSIGGYAFSFCTGLTGITIPESVTLIGSNAFFGCEDITSITIPKNVTTIGDDAFLGCWLYVVKNESSLDLSIGSRNNGYAAFYAKMIINADDTITYRNDENTYILTEDGFLFSKSAGEYTLIAYTGDLETVTLPLHINGATYELDSFHGARNVIIPKGMTSIGKYSFCCAALNSITIPDSVTSIGNEAFYCCDSLTSITIPSSVTSIGDKAFSGCTNLETITFKGTEEQWNAITKGSSWDCDAGSNTSSGKYNLIFEK